MSRPPLRFFAFQAIALVLSTTIALGAAEGIFRWYSRRTYLRKMPAWTENLIPVPGAQVFRFKAHASGVFPGGVDETHTFSYRTNAYGLRDRDRPGKAQGEQRVLVMGDSYTWGYAVAEDEAFPQVAERLLHERGHANIDVINGGIPDYNSRQERRLLEQLLPLYAPDTVYLAYVVNDAEPSTAMPNSPDEAFRHSTSWFLTEAAERLNRRVFHRRVLPSSKDDAGDYLDSFDDRSIKWQDSREAIREMRDLCAARGISLTVLMLPDFTQEFDQRYSWTKIHAAVARWGRELNIPVVDLLDTFRGENHQAFYVPWDGHPNADAHRRIAEVLVGRILAADEPHR